MRKSPCTIKSLPSLPLASPTVPQCHCIVIAANHTFSVSPCSKWWESWCCFVSTLSIPQVSFFLAWSSSTFALTLAFHSIFIGAQCFRFWYHRGACWVLIWFFHNVSDLLFFVDGIFLIWIWIKYVFFPMLNVFLF